jgi:hypothetical protein
MALVEALVDGMPRLVVGVAEAEASRLVVRSIWESQPAVGAYLRRLAAPVPGIGEAFDGLLALGVGIELPQLRNGLQALLREVVERGSDCEWVEPAAIEALIPQLNLALGPMTAGIKGFNLRIGDLEIDPVTEAPRVTEASLLAAVDDPRGVFALGAMFNPALAAVEVPTDGTPVPLPPDLLPYGETPPLQVAIRDKRLLLMSGNAVARSATLLDAPVAAPPPLFSVDYGVRQLVGLLDAGLERAVAELAAAGEADTAEQLRVQFDDFRAQAELFERLRIALYATEQGLVMDQVMQLH